MSQKALRAKKRLWNSATKLMSPEQKRNKNQEKKATNASRTATAELYEGLSLTFFFVGFARYL